MAYTPNNQVRRRGSFAPLPAHYYLDGPVAEVDEAAELLWVRAWAFCAATLCDGFITWNQLIRGPGVGMSDVKERASRLVAAGAWEEWGDTGYYVPSWGEWNKSRDEIFGAVEADRQRKIKRGGGPSSTPPEGGPGGGQDVDRPTGFRPESNGRPAGIRVASVAGGHGLHEDDPGPSEPDSDDYADDLGAFTQTGEPDPDSGRNDPDSARNPGGIPPDSERIPRHTYTYRDTSRNGFAVRAARAPASAHTRAREDPPPAEAASEPGDDLATVVEIPGLFASEVEVVPDADSADPDPSVLPPARRRTRQVPARKTPAEWSALARSPAACDLVKAWADAQPAPPVASVVVRLGQQASPLLTQGWSVDDVTAALDYWAGKTVGPGCFQSVADEWRRLRHRRVEPPRKPTRVEVGMTSGQRAFAALRAQQNGNGQHPRTEGA